MYVTQLLRCLVMLRPSVCIHHNSYTSCVFAWCAVFVRSGRCCFAVDRRRLLNMRVFFVAVFLPTLNAGVVFACLCSLFVLSSVY